jgi:hypothetical protein
VTEPLATDRQLRQIDVARRFGGLVHRRPAGRGTEPHRAVRGHDLLGDPE